MAAVDMDYSEVFALARILSKTREYTELKAAKQKINQNQAYAVMFADFGKLRSQLNNPDITQTQAERIYADIQANFNKLSNIAEFRAYFSASADFDDIFSSVIQRLGQILNDNLN